MNILRALLGGLVVAAAVVGCGSDGGNKNASKLAACASGSSSNTACSSCVQDKCSAAQKKCYGDDYNGGVCQSYASCVLNAPDPCKPTGCATPSGDCQTCIMEVSACVVQNCTSACSGGNSSGSGGNSTGTGGSSTASGGNSTGTGGSSTGTGATGSTGTGGSSTGTGATGSTGGGNCAKLNACCGRITQTDLKSGCMSGYSQAKGDESLCYAIYNAVSQYCP